jgi:hypothetical protein
MQEQQLQRLNALTAMLVLLEILWLSSALLWAAEGIISKVPDSTGTYCHLKFPAITEATLDYPKARGRAYRLAPTLLG